MRERGRIIDFYILFLGLDWAFRVASSDLVSHLRRYHVLHFMRVRLMKHGWAGYLSGDVAPTSMAL
jgi:hypothetical protein